MYKIILEEDGYKIWESWYGLMCYGVNKANNILYKWSFIFMGRAFTIQVCPKAIRYSIQIEDLYHWEPTDGPPKTIFYNHN